MQINMSELRYVTEELLNHLEETQGDYIKIMEDYYWDIPADKLYNMAAQPTEFTVGQLSDDWAELKKLLDTSRAPISYSLVWLASILRRIGEKTVS
jgi:hypothetical protein